MEKKLLKKENSFAKFKSIKISENKKARKLKSKNKIISTIILVIVLIVCLQKSVYAANYSVNVEFDGKNLEMTSENPKMEWNIRNLYTGEPVETTIIINSTGIKEVEIELKTEIVEGAELGEILNLKIVNNQTNEAVYEGKYNDFQNYKTRITAKETNSYKVIVEKTSNEEKYIQKNNCRIKFKITAIGEKNTILQNKIENNETNETSSNTQTGEVNEANTQIANETEKIITSEIKPIKKQQAYIMYIVLAIMVIVLGILVVQFLKTKR